MVQHYTEAHCISLVWLVWHLLPLQCVPPTFSSQIGWVSIQLFCEISFMNIPLAKLTHFFNTIFHWRCWYSLIPLLQKGIAWVEHLPKSCKEVLDALELAATTTIIEATIPLCVSIKMYQWPDYPWNYILIQFLTTPLNPHDLRV